jgi:clan AA aspartic protease (TIGR02281 family)
MSKQISIVAARRGRAAIGRQILLTLAGAITSTVLLIAPPGRGFNLPAPQITEAGNALILPASQGWCSTDLWIGDTRLRGAIADSGATGWITIGRNQARQAGIDVARLRFSGTYESANGRGHFAQTLVRWVRIGTAFQVIDVKVAVTDVDQTEALIGIELLRDLNFRVRADHCELSWGKSA